MSTLESYLRSVGIGRRKVTKAQFEKSRGDLSGFASWAVWGAETGDPEIWSAAGIEGCLRKDVFLMGGNTGLFKGGRTTGFSNFHTKGHKGDSKLRKALTGTELEGAYLTDLVKNCPTKDASDLVRGIRAGKVDVRSHVVDYLLQELKVLDSPSDTIVVLMGRGTVRVWDEITAHPAFPTALADSLRVISGIDHYTARSDFGLGIKAVLNTSMNSFVEGHSRLK